MFGFRILLHFSHYYFANKDINECLASMNPCDENSRCQNNNGSFSCICDSGFTGDGLRDCSGSGASSCIGKRL